jgi:predicted Zn-dependent protease
VSAARGSSGERAGRLPPPHEVVERALAASRADGCAVVVEETSVAEVRFANNTTTTNGLRRDRSVSVVSFRASAGGSGGEGTSAGTASASGSVDVEALVRASEREATASPPAEDAAPLVGPSGDETSFSEPAGTTDLGALSGLLGGLGGAFARARAAGRVLAGFAEHALTTTYLGISTGARLRHVQPSGKVELVSRSADGARSAWAGKAAASFEESDLLALEGRLAERLGWAERSVELPPGRYETLLPPEAVADLMVSLAWSASGRNAEDGQSVFSAPGGRTRIGHTIAELPFDLYGDPAEPGLECAPFLVATASDGDVSVFDNGLALSRTAWIGSGRLEHLVYNRARAARSGLAASPPIDNLVLELPGATSSVEEMVSRTERSLLLTCLWYIREVDPATLLLTGLTRDGIYLVERGEVVGAVNNFRFNESPLDVLARTVEAGGSVRALSREWGDYWNRSRMPPLRVAEFNMSSVSPAT